MSPEDVIAISQQALLVLMLISAPMLLSALCLGLMISLFQAATQINEMTLSFIPKILALIGALFIGGPWMLNTLVNYTQRLIADIPSFIG